MGYYFIEGKNISNYISLLRRLVSVSLSRYYPDIELFLNTLNLWDPSLNSKVNNKLPLDAVTNLPSEEAFTRLINEQKLYLNQKKLSSNKDLAYYEKLLNTDFSKKQSISVSYLKAPGSYFLILDRYDISESLLVRYTLEFENGGKPLNVDNSDFKEFADMFFQISKSEAIFTLMLLESKNTKFSIKQISRGKIGPLWFYNDLNPLDISNKHIKNTYMLNFPLDIAGKNLSNDYNNDPFEKNITNFEKKIKTLKSTVQNMGYKIYKERRVNIIGEYTDKAKKHLFNTYPQLIFVN